MNTTVPHIDGATPTPEAIRAARAAAGHSQAAAAELVHLGHAMRWSEYERGARAMDPARWALYLLLTDQHPALRVVARSGRRRAADEVAAPLQGDLHG